MKIKADFITNSSTTMYVIEFSKEYLRKHFEQHFTLRTGERLRLFKDKRSLIKYTQDDDVDWITEVTKQPLMYWGMPRDEFEESIQILDEGKYVVYVEMDRNDSERTDRAEDVLRENGGIIRMIGGD
jgi:hypothetical protein